MKGEKKMEITYKTVGDYRIPNLLPPQTEEKEIGIWGMRHLRYIKQHRKARYTNLLTTGKLNEYLAEIDERAQNMKAVLVRQMSEHEGANEMLKEQNQLEWVGRMNNIRNRAKEIIYNEVIYK